MGAIPNTASGPNAKAEQRALANAGALKRAVNGVAEDIFFCFQTPATCFDTACMRQAQHGSLESPAKTLPTLSTGTLQTEADDGPPTRQALPTGTAPSPAMPARRPILTFTLTNLPRVPADLIKALLLAPSAVFLSFQAFHVQQRS